MRLRRGAHAPRVPFPAPSPESQQDQREFIPSVFGGGAEHRTRGRVRSSDNAADAALLEQKARELLRQLGAAKLAREIRVEWNPRMKSAAGRADFREKLISLNPLLDLGNQLTRNESSGGKLECNKHSSLTSAAESMVQRSERRAVVYDEIDRTLRHELAHLLAQWRVGRRRIAPHGAEWREACRDLDIADEVRCHNLPFAIKAYAVRFVYRCPNCRRDFPRVRRVRRAIACLACCRAHNRGEFDPRFRLRLISKTNNGACPP